MEVSSTEVVINVFALTIKQRQEIKHKPLLVCPYGSTAVTSGTPPTRLYFMSLLVCSSHSVHLICVLLFWQLWAGWLPPHQSWGVSTRSVPIQTLNQRVIEALIRKKDHKHHKLHVKSSSSAGWINSILVLSVCSNWWGPACVCVSSHYGDIPHVV